MDRQTDRQTGGWTDRQTDRWLVLCIVCYIYLAIVGQTRVIPERGFQAQFCVYWSCPLSTSWLSKDKKVLQSVSRFVSQHRSHRQSDHGIRKLASTYWWTWHCITKAFRRKILFPDWIHFYTLPMYMAFNCKDFSGAVSSIETENASETRFQMPKPVHADTFTVLSHCSFMNTQRRSV